MSATSMARSGTGASTSGDAGGGIECGAGDTGGGPDDGASATVRMASDEHRPVRIMADSSNMRTMTSTATRSSMECASSVAASAGDGAGGGNDDSAGDAGGGPRGGTSATVREASDEPRPVRIMADSSKLRIRTSTATLSSTEGAPFVVPEVGPGVESAAGRESCLVLACLLAVWS